MVGLGLGVLGEEDYRGKVLFLPHYIKGIYDQHDLSLFMLPLLIWFRKCPISPLKSYSFLPLAYHTFKMKSLCAAHT